MAILFKIQGVSIGWVAIMLSIIASMGGFIFGYETGQISDILLMDDFLLCFATCSTPGDASTCAFSTVREGIIVAILSIGTLVGALLSAPIADLLGRCRAMSVECLVYSIGVAIQVASYHVWQQFAVGRFVSGLGVGALSATVPMYQAETAPYPIRGTLTATYQLFITLGILVAYCFCIVAQYFGPSASWRIVISIGTLWAAILGIGILFMPESPRWLAMKGKTEKARESLMRAHGLQGHSNVDAEDNIYVDKEMEEITPTGGSSQALHDGWADCFRRDNGMLYRTLLGMSLQSLQQLSGANYFFYYGATIFKSVGLNNSFVTQFIFGAVNFICTFGGMYVLERYGRRKPLIIGGIWQAVWLFVFASAGTIEDPTRHAGMGRLMIISACMFIWGFAMTWAPGVWILVGEIFDTKTRAKQGSLSTATNWAWNFLLAFFTPSISRAIGYHFAYIPAACNFIGVLVVYYFLRESADQSLEDVNKMYSNPPDIQTPETESKHANA